MYKTDWKNLAHKWSNSIYYIHNISCITVIEKKKKKMNKIFRINSIFFILHV